MVQASQFLALNSYLLIDDKRYQVEVETDQGVKHLIIHYADPILVQNHQ